MVLKQIDETTWCGNDDLGFNPPDIVHVMMCLCITTSKGKNASKFTEFLNLISNLKSQLSGGLKDDGQYFVLRV